MKQFLDACLKANLQISKYLDNICESDLEFSPELGYDNNQSYKLDLKCEEIFIEHLNNLGQIFSEESGLIGENSPYKIILDPLDGSSNFVSKIPFYGTSAALFKDEKAQSAFICNLANYEILAFDGHKSLKSNLLNPCYSPFLPHPFSQVGVVEKITLCPSLINYLAQNKLKFRSLGATALSIAYASYFSFVLVLGKTRIFDTAGALMLCKDLHIENNENFLLISKDKQTFDIILEFFK